MAVKREMDLSLLENQIRSGKGEEAREALQALRSEDLRIADACTAAALCRRVSLYQKGFEILRPHFFKQRELSTPDERLMAEYAAMLSEVGASAVAARIFAKIPQPTGMTRFYLGLSRMKNWDYQQAGGNFHDFLLQVSDPYWRRIGLLNSISCAIFNRDFSGAETALAELRRDQEALSPMAFGSMLELEGQLLYFRGDLGRAQKHFFEAYHRLKDSGSPAALFAEKWKYICRLEDPDDSLVESELEGFLARLKGIGAWETLRELDRFIARRKSGEDLLHKLHFGTPYAAYRAMLARDFNYSPPVRFRYLLGPAGEPAGVLHLGVMQYESGGRKFSKLPGSAKKLLSALLRDLYRPLAIGSLFEHLFAGEFFDPSYGPDKTYQVIKRFRVLCSKENLPFRVNASALGFTLESDVPVAIEYEAGVEFSRRESADLNLLYILQREFSGSLFSLADAAQVTELPARTLSRRMAALVEKGEVELTGKGRGSRYRLKASVRAA